MSLLVTIILVLSYASSCTWAAPGDSPNDPIIINTAADLDNVRVSMDKYFRLGGNIDLTAYLAAGGAGFTKWGADGWEPLGDLKSPFTGGFDGNKHVISGLWINRSTKAGIGLFGVAEGATIANLGVECSSAGIIGDFSVGTLVGMLKNSKAEACYARGIVSGDTLIGGLVGNVENGSIANCYATGNVRGYSVVGGLAGLLYGLSSTASITNSYATGNVTVSDYGAGGLVGEQSAYSSTAIGATSITNSYSTGNVSGRNQVHGLVGSVVSVVGGTNTITRSYRYQLVTVNGAVRSDNTPTGVQGGTRTADEFMNKATYTNNFWLFNDSVPTTGPWHWDGRGFPKLNIGSEDLTFPFTQSTPGITINTQPRETTTVTLGSISSNLSVSASTTLVEPLTYQWYVNTEANNQDGTPLKGATSAVFSIPTDLKLGIYYFYCIISVTDKISKASNVATVTVVMQGSMTGIAITPKTATIAVGETQKLNASIIPENATNVSVTWSSNNPAIAVVNQSGWVRGVKEGTTTITARSSTNANVMDTGTVTITPAKSEGSGGGCSAYGYLALIILAIAPLVWKR